MILLQAIQLTYQLPNGESLFKELSFTLTNSVTGLVGRNGSGKSILAGILNRHIPPASGTVRHYAEITYFSQQEQRPPASKETIASYIGVDEKLQALSRIEAGSTYLADFDLLADDWLVRERLTELLLALRLPPDPATLCTTLSGGQLTLLRLWNLFDTSNGLLILDEPSNHLDSEAKNWLIEQIKLFDGGILLISHDRTLLRHVNQILALDSRGIQRAGGNYDDYDQARKLEQESLGRKIDQAKKEKKQAERQAQINAEKARKREAQGNRMKKSGSQAPIILGAMKNDAQSNASARLTQEANQQSRLNAKLADLKSQQSYSVSQYMEIGTESAKGRLLASLSECYLPYGRQAPLSLFVSPDDKLHLKGGNGTGKSTLLKLLLGEVEPREGTVLVSTSLCYLDQHFSLLDRSLTMLDNLLLHCPYLDEGQARTLLATIGFRGDKVFKLASRLSGGEKMKLAMLSVCHQQGSALLLLDEPDNHLDLESKQMLAASLKQFAGSFILISHDDDFVRESGISRSVDISK